MSVGYTWVQWNRQKRVYDAVAVGAVMLFMAVFVVLTKWAWQEPAEYSDEVLLIRATGACAFTLLHVVLAIGPLARLNRRWLPVLYNRRHLGVLTFLVALTHGILSLGYYHGFGVVNPLVSLLTSNTNYASFTAFPFQVLGALALGILLLLAATSHDFWNRNLSAAVWKRLHMLVYVAYALLVGHVCLGALQASRSSLAPTLVVAGAGAIIVLHLVAGVRELRKDRGVRVSDAASDAWIDVGAPDEIPIDRARTVCTAGGERIAVFRFGGEISAVTNVCVHQGGPLGEGKVVDGCITCPWHGWQYRPRDGCSPPPFQEKIATYQVRILAGRVQVHAAALPPGTPTSTVRVPESEHA